MGSTILEYKPSESPISIWPSFSLCASASLSVALRQKSDVYPYSESTAAYDDEPRWWSYSPTTLTITLRLLCDLPTINTDERLSHFAIAFYSATTLFTVLAWIPKSFNSRSRPVYISFTHAGYLYSRYTIHYQAVSRTSFTPNSRHSASKYHNAITALRLENIITTKCAWRTVKFTPDALARLIVISDWVHDAAHDVYRTSNGGTHRFVHRRD